MAQRRSGVFNKRRERREKEEKFIPDRNPPMTSRRASSVATFSDVVRESFARRIENICSGNGVYMADWVCSREISTHLRLEEEPVGHYLSCG